MSPSCCASSKTALAYLLAAAVGTRHLLNRVLDQPPVFRIVEPLADDLFGRVHHERRHLCPHRLDRLLALRVDFLACRLGDAPRLFLCLLPQVLTGLLARPVGRIDQILSRLARVVELRLRLLQPRLGICLRPFCLPQLLRDGALPRLGQPDDLRVDPSRKDGEHHQERDQLDHHGAVDVDDASLACEIHDYLTCPRKTNPNARLMKYIASTRPTIVNNHGIIRPCASGWRATPPMKALPARPSPKAAPTAPSPISRPNPIKAPASSIP